MGGSDINEKQLEEFIGKYKIDIDELDGVAGGAVRYDQLRQYMIGLHSMEPDKEIAERDIQAVWRKQPTLLSTDPNPEDYDEIMAYFNKYWGNI